MTGIGYRLMTLAGAVALACTLGGCLPGFQKSGPGGASGETPATTVITGDAILSTPLGPPGAAANTRAGASAPATSAAAALTAPPPAENAAAPAPTTTAPTTTGQTATDQSAPVPPHEADVPVLPEAAPVETNPFNAEARLTCEKAGGSWAKTGSGFNSCVWGTRDSGKRCTASTQCDGQCLARSGTCAPMKPMFGCTEILDDSGRRMTECLQ